MGSLKREERNFNLDITRCTAILCVISVHFFLNTGFYEGVVAGGGWYALCTLRTLFMVCVPLFLLLTGCLMGNREIEIGRKYYLKLSKVLVPYVLITCVLLLFRHFDLHESLTFRDAVLNITSYSQYSWYVNMYIGLYLLIPFLNRLWKALEGKMQGYFVLTLVLLTALPTLLNSFNWKVPGWWLQPSLSASTNQLVPDWWEGIYPLTYYFLGAYLEKHQVAKRLRPWAVLLALAACLLLFGWQNYRMSEGKEFVWGAWNRWQGYQNLVDTVLVYLFLNSLSFRGTPHGVKRFAARLSNLAFGAYIASWMMDQLVYPVLNSRFSTMSQKILYLPLTVLVIYTGATLISLLADLLYRAGKKLAFLALGTARGKMQG